jgi:aspartate/methionine/tyrosine aminotransferase
MSFQLFFFESLAVNYPLFLTKLLIRTGLARWLPSVRRLIDGAGPFLHYYSNAVLNAPLADIREMSEFLDIHGADAVNLALSEPRFDLAPSASTKLPADLRGWPPFGGLPELREAVAAKLERDQSLSINPTEEVLITPGLSGAFHIALNTFVNPGDHVALFDPASPLYRLALQSRGARIHWIPTWVESGRTRFHMEPFVRALRHVRMIVVNSPTNPTGGVLAPEDLEQIVWWADRRDVLIFSDDVFKRFIYEDWPISIGTLAKGRKRTLTAGSVSKGYGLASARVGWLAGHRHLIRPCALTAVLHSAWVPTLCQQIATAALRQGNEPFEPIRREFDRRRRYTFERLQAMNMKPIWPAGGFFVWLPVRELNVSGITFARKLLKFKRVLVSPGEFFGPSGAGYVRISYATDDGRLREGLTRLTDFVREIRGLHIQVKKKAA